MSSIVQKASHAPRILLGLGFAVFGLNGFLQFMPQPPVPEAAGAFLGGLAATGYMFPLIKGTEVVAGLMLLSNRFVPFALTLLAPILVNIVLFHVVLAPAGTVMALVFVALEVFVAWTHRDAFRGVLAARHEQREAPSPQVADSSPATA